MSEIVIVAGADDNYAMPMTVTLHSALYHLNPSWRAIVYIVDGGIELANRLRCENSLLSAHPNQQIVWVKPDLAPYNHLSFGQYSSASLIRLLIPEIVPSDCLRVIYLDSDIVVDDDLSKLWQVKLGNQPVGAVKNHPGGEFDARIRNKFRSIVAPENAEYFNSGVLVINLPEWKKQRVSQRSLEFWTENDQRLSFPDQDSLNAVLAGNWVEVESRWNAQVHGLSRKDKSCGITHYTTFKPWQRGYTFPRKGRFFQAYLRTKWNSRKVSLAWVAGRLGEQIIRQNVVRIRNRLG